MGSVNQGLPWEKRVAVKQQVCADKIPTAWRIPDNFLDNFQIPLAEKKNNLIEAQAVRKSGILTEQELRITENYTIAELLSALADGTLTSAEVTLAYSKRAAVAQQLVSIQQAHPLYPFFSVWPHTHVDEGELSHRDYVRRGQGASSISRHSSGARPIGGATPWPSS
jgi:hypothetical protein